MTKSQIVDGIAKRFDMQVVQTRNIVQAVIDEIINITISEGNLELRNFGVFAVKTRKARKARNPRTGQEVMVPEHKIMIFKPGKLIEDRLNKSTTNTEVKTEELVKSIETVSKLVAEIPVEVVAEQVKQ